MMCTYTYIERRPGQAPRTVGCRGTCAWSLTFVWRLNQGSAAQPSQMSQCEGTSRHVQREMCAGKCRRHMSHAQPVAYLATRGCLRGTPNEPPGSSHHPQHRGTLLTNAQSFLKTHPDRTIIRSARARSARSSRAFFILF